MKMKPKKTGPDLRHELMECAGFVCLCLLLAALFCFVAVLDGYRLIDLGDGTVVWVREVGR